MSNPTDSGTLVRLAYQGLKSLDVDADEVLRRSGFDPSKLYQANLRTPFSAQPRFWQAATELSNNPCIGLHIAEKMPVYKGQILEYLLLSSATFGDGLKRVLNYQRLVSDALHGALTEGKNPYLTSYFSNHEYATSHLAEAMVLGLIRTFETVTEGAFAAEKIVFNHPPNTNMSEYERVFKCPVEFNARSFRLYFPASALNYRSLYAEPQLLSVHVQAADQHLAVLRQADLIKQVRSHIASLLESGDVTLESVSNIMGVSVRQLRHQLSSAGTNFQKILNDLRHRLAVRLLSQTSEDISEIIYLTGFCEPSTFYRAFKRWEGTTPIHYRNKHQSGNDH